MSIDNNIPSKLTSLTDPNNWEDLKVIDFEPKNFEADDVELTITHCGVCGSDVHTLTQGWGKSKLPLIAGHEIVGTVTRVFAAASRRLPGIEPFEAARSAGENTRRMRRKTEARL